MKITRTALFLALAALAGTAAADGGSHNDGSYLLWNTGSIAASAPAPFVAHSARQHDLATDVLYGSGAGEPGPSSPPLMGYSHRQELDTDIIYGVRGLSISGERMADRSSAGSGGV
jgi:hypothetical protein